MTTEKTPLQAVDRDVVPRYEWGSNSYGWRLVDQPDLSVMEERVPPGSFEDWHVHDRARQFFYILSGHAEMRTFEGTVTLPPGTGVEVPPGIAHQFANTGDSDAVFLVASAPTTQGDRRAPGPAMP